MARVSDIRSIGNYLQKNYLDVFGLTQHSLARAVGVGANRITDIVNGNRGITMDTDLRLCKYFNLEYGTFLRVQEQIERDAVQQKLSKRLNKIIPIK